MRKFIKGFTLIELLIVISIIGLLSTLLLANMFGVREKGRDAIRKSDISQIQKALEIYKSVQTPNRYPDTASFVSALQGGTDPAMKVVPNDPKCTQGTCPVGWPNYTYTLDTSVTAHNLKYTLVACLENRSDPAASCPGDALCATLCSNSSACVAANGTCYIRTEP